MFAWLVELCADLCNRLQIGSDSKTAYQRINQGQALEPGDGGVWHGGDVQSVWESARIFDGRALVPRNLSGDEGWHGGE